MLHNEGVEIQEVRKSIWQPHCIEAQLLHPVDVGRKVLRYAVSPIPQALWSCEPTIQ